MPKVKKQSAKKLARQKRIYMKERRKDVDQRLFENSKQKVRMAELRKLDDYHCQVKETGKYYKQSSRKNETFRTQENISNKIRMSQTRQNDHIREKERENDKTAKRINRQDPQKRQNHCDDVSFATKKARLDPGTGVKIREREREAKRKTRMSDILIFNETFSSNLSKKVKLGDEKSKLYQTIVSKQQQALEICTCCLRKLYDGISKLTTYKKEIICQKKLDDHAYNYKNTNFICDSCWNSLRLDIIPKKAGTKNLSFAEIPECLKRLSPLGVRLVSPWLPFLQVVPLQQYTANPQLSLRGNIVNIQVDVGEMLKCLPRRPDEAQVIQIILKRKMEYKSNYMAEAIVVEDIKKAWKFLKKSTLYIKYDIKTNEEFFSQLTQEKFPFVLDEKDKEYLLNYNNELFKKFSGNDDNISDDEETECNGNFDSDDILVIDQNRETADLTRIIAPGENKIPKPLYEIPNYEIFCHPHIFGGEPFDELKVLSVNERHKLWLTHQDSRCRHDPTFVLLLGQMTVQKRTRDSMNFVTRRGCKNKSLNAGKVIQGKVVDELIQLNEAYKFLTPIVGSPAYLEDKKKFLIAKIAQLNTPHVFITLSLRIEENPYLLQQLFEEKHRKPISLIDALNLTPNDKALLIRNNPVTCARYIHRYFTTIINCFQKLNGPFGKFHYVDDYAYKDEVQQKGHLHRHMVCWLMDAPRYDPDDDESEKRCVEFIDNFITCKLVPNNPYVMGCQIHKHTFTCYKGAKNLKTCRFHYPLWPMPRTRILTKLSPEERTEKVKMNFDNVKNYLHDLDKSPQKISFPQILQDLQMSEADYLQAARYPLKTCRVFLQRESDEIFVNAYNLEALNLLKSNMDIQFICDPYACVNYLTDYVVKVEKDMAKLFRTLIEQFGQEDFTNLEKVKKFANAFINSRTLAAQEAACLVLHLAFFKSSRTSIFVPTFPIEDRSRVLKRMKELGKLDPESTDIYQDNIIDKYCRRPKQYLSMCLADYATIYSDLNKINSENKMNYDSAEDSCSDDNISVQDEPDRAKVRKKRKILRIRHYNKYQDPENYYREQLLLFLPFKNEKTEIEDVAHKEVYDKNELLINSNRKLIYSLDEDFIEDIVREVETDSVQSTNDNNHTTGNIKSPKKSANDEFVDIFTETRENNSSNTDEKNYKISVPKIVEEDDILKLLLQANEEQLRVLMHCLHAEKCGIPVRLFISGQAGTGKSTLIKLLYQVLSNYYNKQIPCLNIETPKVLLAAPSGKAAFVIGGVTIHSCFSLPRDNSNRNLPSLSSSTVTSMRFEMRDVKVVIIDEVSMIGRNRLNQIDTRLRQITGNNSAFGGLSVIFVGDLRQLPPVMDKPVYYTAQHYLRDRKLEWLKKYPNKPFQPNIADPAYLDLFASDNWIDFEYYELTKVMRQDNRDFVNALNNLSMGTMTEGDISLIKSRCNLKNIPHNSVHLFYTNAEVDAYNDKIISNMTGRLFKHEAKDHIQGGKKLTTKMHQKVLDALYKLPTNKTGCLPKMIYTKIGAKLMITRNIKTHEGLVNGATGILRHVTEKDATNEILTFWLEFESNDIGRATRSNHLSYLKNNKLPTNLVPIFPIVVTDISVGKKVATRTQFPLVSAESVTVHKSQGQTYASVCVHNKSMTRVLQYVAYSRVCNCNNLFIIGDFKPPLPLDSSSDLKVELDRLKTEKRLITFEQPLEDLVGKKIIFHNALSVRKYIGCVRNDKWFYGADILIFAEARTLPEDNVLIEGFEIMHRSDQFNINKKFKRGLLVYKKNDVDASIVNKITHDSRTENAEYSQHIDLVTLKTNDLYIVCGYRSPHASINLFKQCIDSMINSCGSQSNLVIIGDFNEDCYRIEPSWLEKYLHESRNLDRALPPGLSTTNLNTEIDMIFTNLVDYVSGTYESVTSDHKPVYFCDKANKLIDRKLVDHLTSSKHTTAKPMPVIPKTERAKLKDDNDEPDAQKINDQSSAKKKKLRKPKIAQNTKLHEKDKKIEIVVTKFGASDLSFNLLSRILLDVSKTKTLEDLKIIWQQNIEFIQKINTYIENLVGKLIEEVIEYSTDNRKFLKYELKTSEMTITQAQVNHLLNNTFSLSNVLADGSCLFRTLSDLLLYDQNKYKYIKIFVINEILSNELKYAPMIYFGGIPVSDEKKKLMEFPQVDDFLRMIARDYIWGNHGTLYAISAALKINVVVIGVDPQTHAISGITKYFPENTRSVTPITLINEVDCHFFSAHRTSKSTRFEADVWEDQPISNVNVDFLFTYYQNKSKNKKRRREKQEVDETDKDLPNDPISIKIIEIVESISFSENLSEIQNIQRENNSFISKQCNHIRQTKVISYQELTADDKFGRKKFPKILLDNFKISNTKPDGNCLYRAIALLLFNNQHKYHYIKLLVIDHILINLNHYNVLCTTNVIATEKLDGEQESDNPKVFDFIRMVARHRIWANEGTTLAISHALEVKLYTFSINVDAKLDMIIDSGPDNSETSEFLTVFNTVNSHYYAACYNNNNTKNNIMNIQQSIWKDLPYVRYELIDLYYTWLADYNKIEKPNEEN